MERGKGEREAPGAGREKKGGCQSKGLRGALQRAQGARLQQAGSYVPLIKYNGINKLFVGAH